MLNELLAVSRVIVLRLNHREARDYRLTTHVCMVARAFGADGIIIADVTARSQIEKIKRLNDDWGGRFWVLDKLSTTNVLKDWKLYNGVLVNLTMYGENIHNTITQLYNDFFIRHKRIMVVVGSSKIPRFIYDAADYNISITNQPHSEAAALAVFLEKLLGAHVWEHSYSNMSLKIVPALKTKGRAVKNEKTN